MKIFGIAALSLFLILLLVQIYSFWSREQDLSTHLKDVEASLETAKKENGKLQADLEYMNNPANLEKELRARFNYKEDGEKMIIIVPKASSSRP